MRSGQLRPELYVEQLARRVRVAGASMRSGQLRPELWPGGSLSMTGGTACFNEVRAVTPGIIQSFRRHHRNQAPGFNEVRAVTPGIMTRLAPGRGAAGDASMRSGQLRPELCRRGVGRDVLGGPASMRSGQLRPELWLGCRALIWQPIRHPLRGPASEHPRQRVLRHRKTLSYCQTSPPNAGFGRRERSRGFPECQSPRAVGRQRTLIPEILFADPVLSHGRRRPRRGPRQYASISPSKRMRPSSNNNYYVDASANNLL